MIVLFIILNRDGGREDQPVAIGAVTRFLPTMQRKIECFAVESAALMMRMRKRSGIERR